MFELRRLSKKEAREFGFNFNGLEHHKIDGYYLLSNDVVVAVFDEVAKYCRLIFGYWVVVESVEALDPFSTPEGFKLPRFSAFEPSCRFLGEAYGH